jgi:transcriptional regulator with XRE-family HTH domain
MRMDFYKIDVKKLFGTALRDLRKGHGMSQEILADSASLHRTYISDIERGKRNPSLIIIVRLAAALKVPCTALFPFADQIEKSNPGKANPGKSGS